jgi:hypothetical protein
LPSTRPLGFGPNGFLLGEAGVDRRQRPAENACAGKRGESLGRMVAPGRVELPTFGLGIHKRVLNRYENLLLYSSFQRVTNRSI